MKIIKDSVRVFFWLITTAIYLFFLLVLPYAVKQAYGFIKSKI